MSNNNNRPDRTGGYRDRMSQRDDADNISNSIDNSDDSYDYESPRETGGTNESNIHIGTDLLSGRRAGMIPSLVILLIFIGVFVFVLPKLDAFNHVIKPDVLTSGSDIPNYIRQGMSGEEVLSLQKALYKLGVFTVDDITGIYDTKSSEAVNKILRDNSMETGGNCSLRAYRMILDMSNGVDVVSVSDGADQEKEEDADKSTAEKEDGSKDDEKKTEQDTEKETKKTKTTTTTTTTSTRKTTTRTTSSSSDDDEEEDEEEETQKVRITEEAVRLYAKMRKSSTILFYVQEDDEYTLLDTVTDDDGNVWYKIQYKDICTGWVQGDKAEVIS